MADCCVKCGAVVPRPGAMCEECKKRHDQKFYLFIALVLVLAILSAVHLFDMLFIQRLFF